MFVYLDVMKKLKESGYNRKRLREENILAQSTIDNICHGNPVSMDSLDTICSLLDAPIEEIIKHVKEDPPDEEYHATDESKSERTAE